MTPAPLHGAVPLLHDYLLGAAARWPDREALVCRRQRLSYRDIDRRSSALAHALRAGGVQRGDRVLVFADNTPEAVVSFWAVLKADAVVSMINPQTKADKLAYLLNDCRAQALITDGHLTAAFVEAAQRAPHLRLIVLSGERDEAALAALTGDGRSVTIAGFDAAVAAHEAAADQPPPRRAVDIDLAAIIYTSGSTGDAKGVMLSHRNMLTAATSISAYLDVRHDEVILNVLPLAFDYGLYQMIMAFQKGAKLVLERSFTFPAEVLKVLVAEGVTGFPGVPTVFAMLAEMKNLASYDFSKVRYVSNTAAALPQKHIDRLRDIFPGARVFSMYGLTECKRCTYLPPEDLDRKPGSVGVAIPNTELWLVDEDGQRIGLDRAGQVGQLVIRGATVMLGYWEKPDETAAKLRPGPLPGERVLYTGDYCRQDSDGYLYFVARMDDIIKSRGEKVSPKEVATALMNVHGVREAAVIGVPDEILGQAVKAFVVLEEGVALTVKELQRECQARLENFMVPKHIELVPSLPRTTTGKISTRGLS